MKRMFLKITITYDSYDYDVLERYLSMMDSALRVSRTTDGFFVDIFYETDVERREIISTLVKLDLEGIELYEVLYEEFLPDKEYT